MQVEREHTADPNVARRIAMDHLVEDPAYYTKLKSAGLEGRLENPIRKVKGGYRYGSSGKVYKRRSDAVKQAQAIHVRQAAAERRRLPGGLTRAELKSASSAPPIACRPFTRVERDPGRFNACMARASQIGPIENSKAIYDLIASDIQKLDEEHFFVLCFDFRGQLRDYVEVAMGQRHRVAIDVEDILAPVLLSKCDGFAVCHCHPSGVTEHSDADADLTKAIRNAAAVACPNVKFVDHVIIGNASWYSFSDGKTHHKR